MIGESQAGGREDGQEAEMRVGKPSQANYKTKRSPEPSYNR
jgi:hypothetical protein